MRWESSMRGATRPQRCGIPKIEEFNRGDNFGNAYFQMNQRRGVRWSATKAFLRPAMKPPEPDGAYRAHVEQDRASRMGARATGVDLRRRRQRHGRARRGAR